MRAFSHPERAPEVLKKRNFKGFQQIPEIQPQQRHIYGVRWPTFGTIQRDTCNTTILPGTEWTMPDLRLTPQNKHLGNFHGKEHIWGAYMGDTWVSRILVDSPKCCFSFWFPFKATKYWYPQKDTHPHAQFQESIVPFRLASLVSCRVCLWRALDKRKNTVGMASEAMEYLFLEQICPPPHDFSVYAGKLFDPRNHFLQLHVDGTQQLATVLHVEDGVADGAVPWPTGAPDEYVEAPHVDESEETPAWRSWPFRGVHIWIHPKRCMKSHPSCSVSTCIPVGARLAMNRPIQTFHMSCDLCVYTYVYIRTNVGEKVNRVIDSAK